MSSGLERIKVRFGCEIDENLISKAYTFLQSKALAEPIVQDSYMEKEQEAQWLLTFIEANDLYFDELKFSVYLDEGAEQKVFFDEENAKVYKLNDVIFYVNWTQYFESLLIHNILFSETKYELSGFMSINNILYSVIQQDYIRPTEKTKIEKVREFMYSKGFVTKKKNDRI